MTIYLTIIVAIVTFICGIVTIILINFIFDFLGTKKRKNLLFQTKLKIETEINNQKANSYAGNKKKERELYEKNKISESFLNKRNFNLQEKEQELEKTIAKVQKQKEELQKQDETYEIKTQELKKEREQIIQQLQEIAGISQQEAVQTLFQNVEKNQIQKLNQLTKNRIDETQKNLQLKINDILAVAIEGFASQYVAEKTTSRIELKDEETKGKIIGKEGRNIKSFEEESGTDIIIENDKPAIKISCFNPIRREIAVQALKKLIQDGRIQPRRIKDTLAMEEKNIKTAIQKAGENTVNELKITNMETELIYHIGLLKFRTSYGQNVLTHCIEVAKITGAMAKELKLNDEIAIRAGLLHDIGKSKDYETGHSHVTLGVELAQKYQESDIVINAIHSHHDDVPKNNVYSVLVSAADTISAARPGARNNMHEDYLKRMETIERICCNIPGVKKSYAIKSGRIIRIIVDSVQINDFEAEKIATQIQKKLKSELKIPGEAIIEVIREFRTTKSV